MYLPIYLQFTPLNTIELVNFPASYVSLRANKTKTHSLICFVFEALRCEKLNCFWVYTLLPYSSGWKGKEIASDVHKTRQTCLFHSIKTYGCFGKWWYPQIINFNRISIINHPFWGTLILGNTHIKGNTPRDDDVFLLKEGWLLLVCKLLRVSHKMIPTNVWLGGGFYI